MVEKQLAEIEDWALDASDNQRVMDNQWCRIKLREALHLIGGLATALRLERAEVRRLRAEEDRLREEVGRLREKNGTLKLRPKPDDIATVSSC